MRDPKPKTQNPILTWFRRKAKPLGARGETLAVKALRRAGYVILTRNARIGPYEVDVIARERDTTAFIEVKTRRHDDPVAPEDNVDRTKRRHIRSAARRYIAQQDDPEMYYRFDVVSVVMPESGKPAVTIHRDAFRTE
jgi:putative endonuclease